MQKWFNSLPTAQVAFIWIGGLLGSWIIGAATMGADGGQIIGLAVGGLLIGFLQVGRNAAKQEDPDQ